MPTKIIEMPNAKITFRNIRGEKRPRNNEGDRNFCVVLTEEQAEEYEALGLPVKIYEPKGGDGDGVMHLLKVALNYKYPDRAPQVIVIKNRGKTYLKESGVGELDYLQLEKIDLVLSASFYRGDDGEPRCTVYLKTMYAKVFEDSFAEQFADLPTIDSDATD